MEKLDERERRVWGGIMSRRAVRRSKSVSSVSGSESVSEAIESVRDWVSAWIWG